MFFYFKQLFFLSIKTMLTYSKPSVQYIKIVII